MQIKKREWKAVFLMWLRALTSLHALLLFSSPVMSCQSSAMNSSSKVEEVHSFSAYSGKRLSADVSLSDTSSSCDGSWKRTIFQLLVFFSFRCSMHSATPPSRWGSEGLFISVHLPSAAQLSVSACSPTNRSLPSSADPQGISVWPSLSALSQVACLTSVFVASSDESLCSSQHGSVSISVRRATDGACIGQQNRRSSSSGQSLTTRAINLDVEQSSASR